MARLTTQTEARSELDRSGRDPWGCRGRAAASGHEPGGVGWNNTEDGRARGAVTGRPVDLGTDRVDADRAAQRVVDGSLVDDPDDADGPRRSEP